MINVKTLNFKYFIAITFAFILVGSLEPYFFWRERWFEVIALTILVISLTLYFGKRGLQNDSIFNLLLFSFLILALQFSYNGVSLNIRFSFLLILVFLTFSKDIQSQIADYSRSLLAYILLIGLFVYILLVLGINLPYSELQPINSLKQEAGIFYRNYFFITTIDSLTFALGSGEIHRFQSILDEPGKLGTICALLLAFDDFKFRTWKEYVFMLSGVLSFSLAFFIIVFIFALFRKPKLGILISILSSIFYFFRDNLSSLKLIDKYLYQRIDLINEGLGKVNNRESDCFMSYFDEASDLNRLTWGLGKGAHSSTGCDVSSALAYIYNFGYFGLTVTLLVYLAIIIKYHNNSIFNANNLFFGFVSILLLYQRPAILSFWFFVFFVTKFYNNETIKN